MFSIKNEKRDVLCEHLSQCLEA